MFETEPIFARIQRAFRFRDDYTPVIRMCSEAGWFLLRHHGKAVNTRKFNQAVAWCTREMLIARAATERLPVFSANGLAEFVGCSAVASVIRSKRNAVIEPATIAGVPGHTPRIWCDRAGIAASSGIGGGMVPCSPKFRRGHSGPRVSAMKTSAQLPEARQMSQLDDQFDLDIRITPLGDPRTDDPRLIAGTDGWECYSVDPSCGDTCGCSTDRDLQPAAGGLRVPVHLPRELLRRPERRLRRPWRAAPTSRWRRRPDGD